MDFDDFPHVKRWYDAMKTRPGVQCGFDVLRDMRRASAKMDDPAKGILFGQSKGIQFGQRAGT